MIRHPRFDEALALHRRVPVVDGHADSILGVLDGQRTPSPLLSSNFGMM